MAFEREIGLALAAGAVAAYPPARDAAQKGAVAVGGALGTAVSSAGDVVIGAGKGAYEGARSGISGNGSATRASTSRASSSRSSRSRSSRSGTSRSGTSRKRSSGSRSRKTSSSRSSS